MSSIRINHEKIKNAEELLKLCPFGAIEQNEQGQIEILPSCRMCKMCIRKGPAGVFELCEDEIEQVDRSAWQGILVYVDHSMGEINPLTYELLGKAREMAEKTGQPAYAIMAGEGIREMAPELGHYGADKIFVYDFPELRHFRIEPYAAVLHDLILKEKPSTVLVGGTTVGRSLAPRVAARLRTGLTADCTQLDMQANTDLDQIRPAFGGNIMAHIRTTRTRPQFATVRSKIFPTPARDPEPGGEIIYCEIPSAKLQSLIQVQAVHEKPRVTSLEQADVIVACGRGIKQEKDLALIHSLADALGGVVAATRPLIERGWFDARVQIGLSGRTVRPKLLITCGISGAIQFVAGMKDAECIISINNDPSAPIIKISHYALIGDLYEIIPAVIDLIKEQSPVLV